MENRIIKNMVLVTLGVLTLLVGCKSTPKEEQSLTHSDFAGAPKWVLTPELEGAIADVGSSAPNAGNDFSYQRQEALADARDNLARQLSVKVNNMIKQFKAATGSGKDATFDKASETVSKQLASETLVGSRAKDTWVSPNGTLFILMALDTQSVTSAMDKNIRTSFKNDKALYQKFLAEKAQGQLDKEIEKYEDYKKNN